MLLGKCYWRNEFICEANKFLAAKLDQDFVILVKKQTVLWTIDSKFVHQGSDLRRERKIGRCQAFIADDHTQFVQDLGFVAPPEKRASKTIRNHLRRITTQKFCNLGDTVTD